MEEFPSLVVCFVIWEEREELSYIPTAVGGQLICFKEPLPARRGVSRESQIALIVSPCSPAPTWNTVMMAAGKVSKLADGVPSMKLNLEVEPGGHKWAGVPT